MDLLAKDFNITNLSEAGVGEYKIMKQITSVNTSQFDITIVSHTSPSRIHTPNHPIHKTNLHKNCDLIYTDIENRNDWFNENLKISKKFFEYHYDDQYQIDVYTLIRKEIKNCIKNRYISISHIPLVAKLSIENTHIDFSDLWTHNRGQINHYNENGNKLIFEKLKAIINV